MLVRSAVRVCVARALLNQTWAGSAVSDSEAGVIETLMGTARKPAPFIVVYTDDDKGGTTLEGLSGPDGPLSLVVEFGCMAAERNEEGVAYQAIPRTGSGVEFILDMIERQIRMVLSDQSNPWVEMFRCIAPTIVSSASLRAAEGITQRYAARQLTLELTTLPEPRQGIFAGTVWEDLVTALEGDTGNTMLNLHGASIRAALEPTSGLEPWEYVAQRYSLSAADAEGMGITPYEGVPGDTDIAPMPDDQDVDELTAPSRPVLWPGPSEPDR